MKKLISLMILMLAALISSANAQESMSCHKPDAYTDICEFDDGRANVTTYRNGDYGSTWFTAREWSTVKAAERRAEAAKQKAEEAYHPKKSVEVQINMCIYGLEHKSVEFTFCKALLRDDDAALTIEMQRSVRFATALSK